MNLDYLVVWRLPFFGDGGGGEERGVTQVVGHHDGRVQRREIQRRDRRVVVTEREIKVIFSSKYECEYQQHVKQICNQSRFNHIYFDDLKRANYRHNEAYHKDILSLQMNSHRANL